MHTLQHAYELLTEKGFCPVYHCKLKADGKGNLISSPYALSVHCPVNMLEKYMPSIPAGYKVVYWPEFKEIRIMPENAKFQFIANQIYSCIHTEQLDCCAKMIETHFPENEILISLLIRVYGVCMNENPA